MNMAESVAMRRSPGAALMPRAAVDRHKQMGLFLVVCMVLVATVTQSQELHNCSVNTTPFHVGNTEDAATLATALECSNGDFAVNWVGQVFVAQTIHVTNGTSLNITGDGPGAVADGHDITQLFVVEDGSRLQLSDMTIAHGNASGGVWSSGGAIYSSQSSVSFSGNVSFSFNSATEYGGAIFAEESTVYWDGDDTQFISNSALGGGAILATDSIVSWSGDDTQFSSNSGYSGGAIYVFDSNVFCSGDGTHFSSNSAIEYGGAILAIDSIVSWSGDGTQFSSNSGSSGGAIVAYASNVSWGGDDTQFSSNSAEMFGGAIYVLGSNVSWSGDDTQFSSNSGFAGGAISVYDSIVSWGGDDTQFSSNSAEGDGGAISVYESIVSWSGDDTQFSSNSAESDGGAIHVDDSIVSWDGDDTQFSSNSANEEGGAIYTSESTVFWTRHTTFSSNVGRNGGAIYLTNSDNNFSYATFQHNSARVAGGAVVVDDDENYTRATFSSCTFSDNVANETGGAVETMSGYFEFISCSFEDNSAGIGGAMRLGGSVNISGCSFLSNLAYSRGLAVAVVGSANVHGSLFDGNELSCAVDLYQSDTIEEEETARFGAVCLDCRDWDECYGCAIERGSVTPTCEPALEHTTAEGPGVTLKTLNIDKGYWRATNETVNILKCYNSHACGGGQTGASSYCAKGYKGPYCAVCESEHSSLLAHTCTSCSSSRRQALMTATVIAAVVAVFAIVKIFRYLVLTELEEGDVGCFYRRVLRAIPIQTLKIVIVVWQILTQFADAANVIFPGVYQDFLSVINLFNFDLGSVLAAGCFWPDIDFHDRLLVSTIGPLVVVGFLAMTYRIGTWRNSTASLAAVEKVHQKHLAALLLLTFLVYSSVSSKVLQTFACETLDDGIEYLRADYRIHCTDVKHAAFTVYAEIMVVVYPVGIPVLYAVLLFQRRGVLADAGADKKVAQSIAGLWEPYRPERFYYEVVECGRRVMLTGVVVLIFPNDAAQIAITMLMTFFFLMVFEMLTPYKSESDMWLSRGGHVIVFLSMFDLMLLKVDVSGERDESQAVFAGVLVAGHVLMILAIFVEVANVCCRASEKKRVVAAAVPFESFPGLRSHAGSDGVPAVESAPT